MDLEQEQIIEQEYQIKKLSQKDIKEVLKGEKIIN